MPLRFLVVFFGFLLLATSAGAGPVPTVMEFAGLRLYLSEDVRQKIAADVATLTRPSKYLDLKLERVDMYLPIVERIFEEEGLPDEFKYLCIQESALISDAVSTSNAVGYWQFKKESALELGMRVDNEVDERKSIIAATRGAARYLKRNNYYLKNWIHTLLSYNLGLSGAKARINPEEIGALQVEIDGNTHWYVLKFLAHKLAFSDRSRVALPRLTLLEYTGGNGRTLSDIGRELETPVTDLMMYNKWLLAGRIPSDRSYTVIIPAPPDRRLELLARLNPDPAVVPTVGTATPPLPTGDEGGRFYPRLEPQSPAGSAVMFYRINGRKGIQAQPGDNLVGLAAVGGVSLDKFLNYNDLRRDEMAQPGTVYYLQKKKRRAIVDHYVAQPDETAWSVAQKFGIRLSSLLRMNRMSRSEALEPGRKLWLRRTRPAGSPEIQPLPIPVRVENKPQSNPIKVNPTGNEKPPISKEGNQSSLPETKPVKPLDTLAIEWEEPSPAENPSFPENKPALGKPAEAPAIGMHTVQPKETLYSIARRYDVAVTDLRSWNGLAETSGVNVGQQIRIARPVAGPEVWVEHTVQAKETLFKIAWDYNVTVAQLQEWNNKPDATLRIGEKLKIRKKQ